MLISFIKITPIGSPFESFLEQFLFHKFNVEDFLENFSQFKSICLKSSILKFINHIFFKIIDFAEVLTIIENDEFIVKNFAFFSKDELCQIQVSRNKTQTESRSKSLYEFYTGLSFEMISDIENFSTLNFEKKKFFLQSLLFLKNLLIYGIFNYQKNKSIKKMINKFLNKIILKDFNFDENKEISEDLRKYSSEKPQICHSKLLLKIINCSFEILFLSQKISIFYKKNVILSTFHESNNNFDKIKQKMSKLLYGIEQDEIEKIDLDSKKDNFQIKNAEIGINMNQTSSQKQVETLNKIYSVGGRKSSAKFCMEEKNSMKYLFLPLSSFLIELKSKLNENLKKEKDLKLIALFQFSCQKVIECINRLTLIQVEKLNSSKYFLKFIELSQSINSFVILQNKLTPQESISVQTLDLIPEISNLHLNSAIDPLSLQKMEDYIRTNLLKLKISFEEKINFKQFQNQLRLDGYISIVEFFSNHISNNLLSEELIRVYLILTNFYVFLNKKNAKSVFPYIDHIFKHIDQKAASNTIMQIVHFSKLPSILEVCNRITTLFCKNDKFFIENDGFQYFKGNDQKVAMCEFPENKKCRILLTSLTSLMCGIIQESKNLGKTIAEHLFSNLQKSPLFKNVYSTEFLTDKFNTETENVFLSPNMNPLAFFFFDLMSSMADFSSNLKNFFRKSVSGKLIEDSINSKKFQSFLRAKIARFYFEIFIKNNGHSNLIESRTFFNEHFVNLFKDFVKTLQEEMILMRSLNEKTEQNKNQRYKQKQIIFSLMNQLFSLEFAFSDGLIIFLYTLLQTIYEKQSFRKNYKLETTPFKSGDISDEDLVAIKNLIEEIVDIFKEFILHRKSYNDFWKFQFICYCRSVQNLVKKVLLEQKSPFETNLIENMKSHINKSLIEQSSQQFMTFIFSNLMEFVNKHSISVEFMLTELFLIDSLKFDEKVFFLCQRAQFDRQIYKPDKILEEFHKTDFYVKYSLKKNDQQMFLLFIHEFLLFNTEKNCKDMNFEFKIKFPLFSSVDLYLKTEIKESKPKWQDFQSSKFMTKVNPDKVKLISIFKEEFYRSAFEGTENQFNSLLVEFHRQNRITCFLPINFDFEYFYITFLKKICVELSKNLTINSFENFAKKNNCPLKTSNELFKVVFSFLRLGLKRKIIFTSIKIFMSLFKTNNFLFEKEILFKNSFDFSKNNNLKLVLEDILADTFEKFDCLIFQQNNKILQVHKFAQLKTKKETKILKKVILLIKFLRLIISCVYKKSPELSKNAKDKKQNGLFQIFYRVLQFFFKFGEKIKLNYSLLVATNSELPVLIEKIHIQIYGFIEECIFIDILENQQYFQILKLTCIIFEKISSQDILEISENLRKCLYLFFLVKLFKLISIDMVRDENLRLNLIKFQTFLPIIIFAQTVFETVIFPKKDAFHDENFCTLVNQKSNQNNCHPEICLEKKLNKCEYILNEIVSIISFICRMNCNNSISDFNSELLEMQKDPKSIDCQSFFSFFEKLEIKVNLIIDKKEIDFFFKMPKIFSDIPKSILQKFSSEIREATGPKDYLNLYFSVGNILNEIQEIKVLSKKKITMFYKTNFDVFNIVLYFFIFVLNVLILFSLQRKITTKELNTKTYGIFVSINNSSISFYFYIILEVLIEILAIFQLLNSIIINHSKSVRFETQQNENFLTDELSENKLIENNKLINSSKKSLFNKSLFRLKEKIFANHFFHNVFLFFTQPSFYYFLFFVPIHLGMGNPFYWSILLLDIIRISSLLRNYFFSFGKSLKWIINLMLLTFILLYIYSTIYFTFLSSSENYDISLNYDSFFSSLKETFLNFIYYGLRNQEGIGSVLGQINFDSKKYYIRFFADLSFLFVVTILVFGSFCAIVIEAYFSFRQKIFGLKIDKSEFCFICGRNRNKIFTSDEDWDTHIKTVHNVKDYFSFFLYLHLNKDICFQGQPSQNIRDMVNRNDFSFMPYFKR